MNNELEELIDRIRRLAAESESGGRNLWEAIYRVESVFDSTMSRLSQGEYRRDRHLSEIDSVHRHLNNLESMISSLRETNSGCARRTESILERFPQMLTALSDTQASSGGYNKFIKDINGFFVDNTAVVVDPYIFSNGNQNQTSYCQHVLDMIGPHPRRIDFYYIKKGYKKAVADIIFNDLTARQCVVHLFECTSLHDRVLMKHPQTHGNPNSNWKARVFGASVNGIASRPTYVIDMPAEDATDYASYLANVRGSAIGHSAPPP